MVASLKEKVIDKPLREDSGARTAARYRYQALFGLVLILERHVLDGDYAVVFEFHDDIALFDSSSEPETVRFYQVKTKGSGEWSSKLLAAQKKSVKKGATSTLPSIIGKMYDNVVAFSNEVEAATFVSNAPAKFSKGKTELCFEECENRDLEIIKERIQQEFPLEKTIRTDLLHFRRTDLSLEDTDTHAKGKLEAFVSSQLGEVAFSVSALFKAVSDECMRKSRAKIEMDGFENIVDARGITRNDAQNWLASVSEVVDCPSWEVISPHLSLPALETARLSKHWNTYRVEVLNPNEAIRRVRRQISNKLEEDQYQRLGLTELVNEVSSLVHNYARKELQNITLDRIKAMVLYETYSDKQT